MHEPDKTQGAEVKKVSGEVLKEEMTICSCLMAIGQESECEKRCCFIAHLSNVVD